MTYHTLRGDMCYVLAPYLDFTSFINFCRIFKPRKNLQEVLYRCMPRYNLKEVSHTHAIHEPDLKLSEIFHECMTRRVNDYLRKLLGQHFEQWKIFMAADHIVLSGSAIVQILLDEEWSGSDLDFFNPILGTKTKGCSKWGYCQFEDFVYSILQPYIHGQHEWPEGVPAMYTFKKIEKVHSYSLNKKKIQVVSIKVKADYDEMNQFIKDSFDLSVLMNIFYYETDPDIRQIVPKLRLNDLNSIMNKIPGREKPVLIIFMPLESKSTRKEDLKLFTREFDPKTFNFNLFLICLLKYFLFVY